MARTALQGEVTSLKIDISDVVREAVLQLDISDDQSVELSGKDNSSVNTGNSLKGADSSRPQGATLVGAQASSWRSNVARFAIAASVASVVLVSAQQLNVFSNNLTTPLVAAGGSTLSGSNTVSEAIEAVPQNSPFAVVDLQNVSGTFNSLSAPQQSRLPQQSMSYSPTQQQKQLQDERVRLYIQQLMLEHAENAAQHSGSGLMPYTRVPAETQR